MRISIVIPGLSFGKGGIERVGAWLANELEARGNTIQVLCENHQSEPCFQLNLSISVAHYSPTSYKKNLLCIQKTLLDFRPDIVIVMCSNAHFLFWPVILAGTNIPFIYSEHSNPWIIENERWNKQERRAVLQAADGIHLLIHDFEASLPRDVHGQVAIIPNPVHFVLSSKRTGKSNIERNICISVGRLIDETKQFSLLIKAFASIAQQHPLWDLQIWGDGEDRNKLEALIQSLDMQQRIFLCGTTDTIEKAYEVADVFCHPARYEGFGLVTAEALACGLPCVGFVECSGTNEIIIDGYNGFLVKDMTIAALATALHTLMQSSVLRKIMAENALTSSTRFAEEHVYQQWENFIHSVVQRAKDTQLSTIELEPFCHQAFLWRIFQRNNILQSDGAHYITIHWKVTAPLRAVWKLLQPFFAKAYHAVKTRLQP